MFAWLFGHHEIDKWRDDITIMAAASLNQIASDLILAAEKDIKSVSWKDGLVGQARFVATRVAPRIRPVAEPVVEHIMEEANRRLGRIAEHYAVWSLQPNAAVAEPKDIEGWRDVAVAAAPLAGGVALAAALPAAAVTTTTAWLGLVTATTISWPVVIGGGALAGVAIATGVMNTAKIWEKSEARLRRKVRDHVVAVLLQGTPSNPSILDQITSTLREAAVQAKGRLR